MLSDDVDVMVGSSGSGFWGGNPPTDPKGSGYVGGDLPPTIGLVVQVVASRFRVGPTGWSGDEDPWIALPKTNGGHEHNHQATMAEPIVTSPIASHHHHRPLQAT